MRPFVAFPIIHRAAIAALVLVVSQAGGAAEFQEGADAHARGDLARARAIFLDLAALGDGPSQYNLGAMSLRGEGTAADRGEATGWMLAARENGHDPTPRAVDELVAKLVPVEREAADRIVGSYGRAALEATVLTREAPMGRSPNLEPPRFRSGPKLSFPDEASSRRQQGIVILKVVIGADGHPRDPELVLSIPPWSDGGRPFAEAAVRGVLGRTYEPARLEGRPLAVNYTIKIGFKLDGADGIVNQSLLAAARAEAAEGAPRVQFLAGIVGIADPRASREEISEAWGMVVAAAQAGMPEAQLFVGRQLARGGATAKALPWLERAAAAGVPGARVSHGLALRCRPDADPQKVRALLTEGAAEGDAFSVRHAVAVLACSEDERLRAPAAALAIAKRISVRNDPDPLAIEAVAAAHASAGDFDGAIDAQRTAVKRAKKQGWDVDEMSGRLAQYEAKRPCRCNFLPGAADGPPPDVAP